jgi:formate hydrogenlyase transcriptional activator
MSMGSKRPNNFGQGDLDILSQISAQISLALDNALAYGRLSASRNRLEDERLYLESEIRAEYNFEDLVGKSPALRKVLDQVEIVAPTGSTVLLRGETGTGKELIARAIHSHSPRRDRTFVRLNCAAIPSGLVESELFGHEKGAFTGALMQKRGRFELADHGTLFLDEIGDISPELQPKLLRALQEQEFERLGSNKTIHVDVRLIAATHRDLSLMIRNNQFREDLFYRLNVFPIEIPPLRERR